MLNYTRIKRLYVKDLLDILRDRRTLIAMIVVPIVLYPLLMLGSIQAASLQADQLKEKPLVIGVQSSHIGEWLKTVLEADTQRVDKKRADADAQGIKIDQADAIRNFKIIHADRLDLEDWFRDQEVADCAVMFELPIPLDWRDLKQIRAKVLADSAEISSALAGARLKKALNRHGKHILALRNAAENRAPSYIHPVVVDEVDVASAEKRGGGMLGQILPLILILMTITGAIYPAIDLTAGERERGTLETLMVCPVPVVEIIIGKFLVVASVAMLGAALNLSSMGLTLHFGGFSEAMASGADTEIPAKILPLILLSLIPLAILFSALMLAVCSFARTFKEAQNYVTPVIICALVPAGLAALPGTELYGVMVVMPVANMVLLTRELLLGNADGGTVLIVLLSTCLYALTAVAVAVRVFGQEAVLFADSGSWRAQFDRHMIRPSAHLKPTLALMYVALLFPIWFYLQGGLQLRFGDFTTMLVTTQVLMILCFAVLPMLMVGHYKVNLRNAFALHVPRGRHVLAAVLIGLSTWALAHEVIVFQKSYSLLGITDDWLESTKPYAENLLSLSPLLALLLLALIPGVCEELLFRGLLLSGLRSAVRRWPAIIAVGLTFAVYHYLIQRFVVTLSLGMLLAYLCWQSRSIFPAMIVHIMHNGMQLLLALPASEKAVKGFLQIPRTEGSDIAYLPWYIAVSALALMILALALCRDAKATTPESPAIPSDDRAGTSVEPALETGDLEHSGAVQN